MVVQNVPNGEENEIGLFFTYKQTYKGQVITLRHISQPHKNVMENSDTTLSDKNTVHIFNFVLTLLLEESLQ